MSGNRILANQEKTYPVASMFSRQRKQNALKFSGLGEDWRSGSRPRRKSLLDGCFTDFTGGDFS
jgi:hypothetical protein